MPTNTNQCIRLLAALISALGHGLFCFIGMIESADDPAPDRTLISNSPEFHSFTSKSNNYAWRNCNIVLDLTPDDLGVFEPVSGEFQINGFGRPRQPRELEVHTWGSAVGGRADLVAAQRHLFGVRALEVVTCRPAGRPHKIAGVLAGLTNSQETVKPIPMLELCLGRQPQTYHKQDSHCQSFGRGRTIMQPGNCSAFWAVPTRKGRINVRFSVRFPRARAFGMYFLRFVSG